MLYGSEPLAWDYIKSKKAYARVSDEELKRRLEYVEQAAHARKEVIRAFNLPIDWDGEFRMMTKERAKALTPSLTFLRSTSTVRHDLDFNRHPSNWITPEGVVQEGEYFANGNTSFGGYQQERIDTQKWEGQKFFKLQNEREVVLVIVIDA